MMLVKWKEFNIFYNYYLIIVFVKYSAVYNGI